MNRLSIMSGMQDPPLLEAALTYVRTWGWPIFPCRGKVPLTRHGFYESTTDEAQIRRWWDWWPWANIALPTGVRSGVVALDVDFPRQGLSSLRRVCAQWGRLPRTRMSRTGNGWHIFYATPDDGCTSTPNLGGRGDFVGLDLKGDGGYIVLPPSLHPQTGRYYQWLREGTVVPCPLWLPRMGFFTAGKQGHEQADRERQGVPAHAANADEAQIWVKRALRKSQEGNRNQIGYWLACRLREAGVSKQQAQALLCSYALHVPAGTHPYREQEALRSVQSAWRSR